MATGSSKVWTVFSLVTALGAAAVARKTLDKSWKVATGKKPPENPAGADTRVSRWPACRVASSRSASLGRATSRGRRVGANSLVARTGVDTPGS